MLTLRNSAIVSALAIAAIVWRDINMNTFLAPGIELVTVLAVVAALLLPRPLAIGATLLTVAAGDLILGSYSTIFLYVWGSWIAIAAGALAIRRTRSRTSTVLVGAGIGVGSTTLFFLVTNFGTWMLGRGEWYADSLTGLLSAYIMGLPFYWPPLLANVVLVPLAALAAGALRAPTPTMVRALSQAH